MEGNLDLRIGKKRRASTLILLSTQMIWMFEKTVKDYN